MTDIMEAFLMRLTDEEMIEHGKKWRESDLEQSDYLREHLQSALTVSQFRTRLYEARRRANPKHKSKQGIAGFVPIKVDEKPRSLTCVLRGKNSLSVEWKAESFAEVRKFALAVLSS